MLRIFFYGLGIALTAFATYYFKVPSDYVDINSYTGSLMLASSMIFTIMGVWVALIYPNALSKISDPKKIEVADFSEAIQDTRRLEALVASILKSGFVAIGVLAVGVGKIAYSGLLWQWVPRQCAIASVLSFVALLSMVQIDAIIGVLFSNIAFLNDMHRRRRERAADSDL